MTTSNTTLASLWVDDVHRSPLKSPPTTPSKNVSEIKDEFAKYYRESGLDGVAKEAGLINANGDLIATAAHPRGAMMIAVPLAGSPASALQPTILPKSSSPMILGTPQRILSSHFVSSPQTPGMSYGSPNTIQGLPLQTVQRKRNSDMFGEEVYSDSKRLKKGEKGGKGLRHFSMKVCEKVQRKGVTSYNEVADELVTEFSDPRHMTPADQQYDQKNIRRRVYDALNVLMAMNIISKEKKEIKWIGLPTNSAQECQNLEMEKQKRLDRIKHKTQQLQELILQQIAFKNLVQRNRELEKSQGAPSSNSAIQLPFIIVNTNKKTVIDCSISNDKYEYLFNFNNTFEIHDDIEVLKRMGMAFGLEKNKCSLDELRKATRMVPKALEPYVQEMASSSTGSHIVGPSSSRASAAAGSASSILGVSSIGVVQSPLALPLMGHHTHDSTDVEVAMTTGHGISRQSSLGSFSDAGPSRGATETPSENFSESESERSSPVDIS